MSKLLRRVIKSVARATHRGRNVVSISLIASVLFVFLIPILGAAQVVPELQVNSTRYIVIDADTGEIFAQKGAHDRAAMASLTKVFTAIEAIERGSLDMTITTKDADLFDEQSSLMGFSAGESFTLEDLLYGMMLPSGNDAAHAIARGVGHQRGDSDSEAYDRFVGWMNERVQNMGLTDTRFVNPHGWGVPGHYSTVYDIAAFTRYALQYPIFVDLISTPNYTAAGGYELTNNNRLLNLYPDLLGGKTGYDWDAGWCLVEVAQRNGSTMISVTFDGIAPDDWYDDNRVLLEYAFDTKERRELSTAPDSADFVTFRDPDAVILSRFASASGSLPQAAAARGQGEPDAGASIKADSAASTSTESQASASASKRVGSRGTANVVIAVLTACVLIFGRAGYGLAGHPLPPFSFRRSRQVSRRPNE